MVCFSSCVISSIVCNSMLFVPAAITVTSLAGIFLNVLFIWRAVRPGQQKPTASNSRPFTSGATPRTIELPTTVTVVGTLTLGSAWWGWWLGDWRWGRGFCVGALSLGAIRLERGVGDVRWRRGFGDTRELIWGKWLSPEVSSAIVCRTLNRLLVGINGQGVPTSWSDLLDEAECALLSVRVEINFCKSSFLSSSWFILVRRLPFYVFSLEISSCDSASFVFVTLSRSDSWSCRLCTIDGSFLHASHTHTPT